MHKTVKVIEIYGNYIKFAELTDDWCNVSFDFDQVGRRQTSSLLLSLCVTGLYHRPQLISSLVGNSRVSFLEGDMFFSVLIVA